MTLTQKTHRTNPLRKHRVGILGLGQMGGSLALALKRQGIHVVGFDIRPSLVRAALGKNSISEAARSERELIQCSQIVVLAVPIDVTLALLEKEFPLLKMKRAVIDLASIRTPLRRVSSRLRLTNHVGIHFVCGTHKLSIESWDERLFEGAPAILFAGRAKPGAIDFAGRLVRLVGATSHRMEDTNHDIQFAVTSGLPHLLAFALAETWGNQKGRSPILQGPSYRSATRVASSNPHLVSELFFLNRKNLRHALRMYKVTLNSLEQLLGRTDKVALERKLRKTAARMNRLKSRTSESKTHEQLML